MTGGLRANRFLGSVLPREFIVLRALNPVLHTASDRTLASCSQLSISPISRSPDIITVISLILPYDTPSVPHATCRSTSSNSTVASDLLIRRPDTSSGIAFIKPSPTTLLDSNTWQLSLLFSIIPGVHPLFTAPLIRQYHLDLSTISVMAATTGAPALSRLINVTPNP